MRTYELNMDGLVGPTHHYAGLSIGNIASTQNALTLANPAKADTHLRYARGVDVDLMTFDNMYELLKCTSFYPYWIHFILL